MHLLNSGSVLRISLLLFSYLIVFFSAQFFFRQAPQPDFPKCPPPSTNSPTIENIPTNNPTEIKINNNNVIKDFATIKEQFEARINPTWDSVEILPSILSFIRSTGNIPYNFQLVFDVGANRGQSAMHYLSSFTNYACLEAEHLFYRYMPKDTPRQYDDCRVDKDKDIAVFSFEPMPRTYDLLYNISSELKWERYNWVGFQCGVGEKLGLITFYGGAAGSQQSSQDPNAAYSSEVYPNITVVSLDGIMENEDSVRDRLNQTGNKLIRDHLQDYFHKDIFLLKIDTEGYDASVLKGASKLLKEGRIRFIIFEYHDKWFTNNRTTTLKMVTTELYTKYNYECFLANPLLLTPIYGDWWADKYELRSLSYVFCSLGKRNQITHWVLKTFSSILNENSQKNLIQDYIDYSLSRPVEELV